MVADATQDKKQTPPTEQRPPAYRKPEVRDYGRIEPRLTFSPPGPPP
jgi:hypothetical protein